MAGELTGELYRKYGTEPPKLKVRPEIQQNVSKSLDVLFDRKPARFLGKRKCRRLTRKGGRSKTRTAISKPNRGR
jgi:hypothetical protein